MFNSITNTWEDYAINQIGQGVNVAARMGDKISITGLKFTGVLVNAFSPLTSDDYNVVRIVCHETEQQATSFPLLTSGLNMNSNIRPDNVPGLKRVLYDRLVPLTPGYLYAGGVPGPKAVTVSFSINFRRPINVVYQGASTTAADRFVWLSMISDSGLVPSPGFTQGRVQLTFKDL